MNKMWMAIAGIVGAAGLAFPAAAADSSTGILLKNHVSVRAEGMAGAQAAVMVDESGAQGFNPAGLSGNTSRGISAVYYSGLVDDLTAALHYDTPWGKDATFGGSLLYYSAGSIELNTSAGETSTVDAQRDILASGTAAYRLNLAGYEFPIGANVKFLYSTLLNKYSAFAAALDLGARLELKGLLNDCYVGVAVKNLGTPLKYVDTADPLPASAMLGAAYDVLQNDSVSVLIAADTQFDFADTWQSGIGTEIWLSNLVAVRGGYKVGFDLAGLTLGLGFQMNQFALDYAYSPMQALNALHRVSVKYMLGSPRSKKKAEAVETAEKVPTVADLMPTDVQPKDATATTKIKAGILEIQKSGGRPSKVIMNQGAESGVRVGFSGAVLDATGRPIAAIVVRQVDPKLSLAEVISLSQDIDENATAVIEKPVEK